MFRPGLSLTLLALAGAPTFGATSSLVRMEASTTWAENISRSSAASDWRDALRWEARASTGLFHQWTEGLTSVAAFDAGFERIPRYTANDATTAGLRLSARQKFGWGAYAPAVSLDASLHRRFAPIDGDDGWTGAASLQASRRLSAAWRVAATADWQQHYGATPIWDTRQHRVFGTLTWDITRNLQLTHGNGRLWGDFTAHASWPVWERALDGSLGTTIRDYYRTVAWGTTHSFGSGWVTYRVTGRVSFWWLELSPALGRNTSLPLRYESRFSVNRVGVKYRQDLWTLQWLHRF
ncbi:MAG: hypothetical protein HZC55_12665 [Verrucomicrobia bacterium]|nr:hypothetical protein [Verrucomicrobiota bacterium]